jgi:uncharacterized protein (TIGR04255 family)
MNPQNSNTASTKVLPSYRNPPINEVVSGMRFAIPDKIRIPHIGILWDRFRKDYPVIQHAPPIATTKGQLLIDNKTGLPLQRVWFINKTDDQLIQFQFDRFYFNWRRRQNDYPRYPQIIRNFEFVLKTVKEFFIEFDLGEFKPIEYELTYINHIPEGQGWDTIDDLPKVFSDFVWGKKKNRFLPNPKNLTWQADFLLPDKKGNLVINLKQATRTEDKAQILLLELRARGIGETTDNKAIREWFDIAREWIVRGFTDLTTPQIQKVWEREDGRFADR